MKIREYINKIGERKNVEDMKRLGDMLADIIYDTKEAHPELYHKYKKCLYEMVYGKVLTKEIAEEIVRNMQPFGEYWSFDTTTNVKNQYGLNDISDVDFYIVMNSKYNDNKDTVDKFVPNDNRKLEMYVDLSKDFILDPDAKPDKVFKYFF